MMKEIFKDIKGYEGLYQISNKGRVKSFKGKKPRILKPQNNGHGYYYVILYENKKYKHCAIHKLVAIHFIPNPLNLPEIDHKDSDKSNNAAYNLEWVTHDENMKRAHSKPIIQYDLQGNFIAKYPSAYEASRQTGIAHSCISRCCNGKLKTAGGYIWRYIVEGKPQ